MAVINVPMAFPSMLHSILTLSPFSLVFPPYLLDSTQHVFVFSLGMRKGGKHLRQMQSPVCKKLEAPYILFVVVNPSKEMHLRWTLTVTYTLLVVSMLKKIEIA